MQFSALTVERTAMSFSKFNFSPELNETLKEIGFKKPTEIQTLAIPPLMESKDILASAETGSGKTAAFLLPIIDSLLKKESRKTRVLVLVPTRELAVQIVEHFNILTKRTRLKAAAVYGGVSMNPQINAFKRNVDLIAATPGRLLDHFQYSYSRLDDLQYLVLDEGDRMLDMGFLPDVRRILKRLPSERQTMLFSATMPYEIVELSKEMLNNPLKLNIQRKYEPASGITHYIFPVREDLKKSLLLKLLEKPQTKSVLAFTRTKYRANRLFDFLSSNSISCERIHGNRSQLQRMEALRGFKNGKYKVLVATDIAARGIDIEGLSTVVNFDVPAATEDYIHRSGRTARAELKGDAFSLVSPNEEYRMRMIEKQIGKRFFRQKVEGFDYSMQTKENSERKSNSDGRQKDNYLAKDSKSFSNLETRNGNFKQRNHRHFKDEEKNGIFSKRKESQPQEDSCRKNQFRKKKNKSFKKHPFPQTNIESKSHKETILLIQEEKKKGFPHEKQIRNGKLRRLYEETRERGARD